MPRHQRATDATPRLAQCAAHAWIWRSDRHRRRRRVQHASPSPMAPPLTPPPHVPLSLSVTLRQGRLLGSTLVAVGLLLLLTVLFRHGVVLDTLDKASTTPTQRAQLVDRYNSYSGNIATAVARPLEVFIGITAQLLVLRVVAPTLVREPQPGWRVAAAALLLAASVGFLVNNGLNALNVQLLEADVTPVIVSSDLTAAATDTALREAFAHATSTANQTITETQARNPVTNTILRNVVLTRVPTTRGQCTGTDGDNVRFPDDMVDYGFAPHDWMKQMLPEALNATQLRVVINATDPHANTNVTSERLPMNASRAADLFLTSVLLSRKYVPWGKTSIWREFYTRYENATDDDAAPRNLTAAEASGLLPPPNDTTATSETAQRRWFLEKSQTFFNTRQLNTTTIDRSDVVLEFAHVDVSPSITFDAITWELTSRALANQSENTVRSPNGTVFTPIGRPQCGPVPGVCLFPRDETDVPVVIHAFAACTYADGTETLQSLPKGRSTLLDFSIECPATSNASMLIVSASKRIVADALQQNARVNETGVFATEGLHVATNLRKIYTFTVGRLAWRWEDLATKYGAACQASTSASGACLGLDVALSGDGGERLIVGAASVPLDLIRPLDYQAAMNRVDQQPLAIVRLVEPRRTDANPSWSVLAGDLLLPHNTRTLTWNTTNDRDQGDDCKIVQEDRQQRVLNNHLYMEAPLHSTYTAALFFLFQHGVVKTTKVLRPNHTTLTFDGNVEALELRISIPHANAALTFAGCVVLVGALVGALVWAHVMATKRLDPLQHITTPHVIARAMLDDTTFPSLLLTRQINGVPAEQFVIDALVLHHEAPPTRSSLGMGRSATSSTTRATAMGLGRASASPDGVAIVTPSHDTKGVALLSKYVGP